MSKSVPAIRSIKARAVVVPMARPVKNAFGVIDAGAAGADRCRDRSGHHRPRLHLCLQQADAEAAGASDRGDRPRTDRQAGRAVRPDGGDGRQIPAARLAGPGRHGGVRPRHGLLGRTRPDAPASRWPNCSAASPRPIKAYDSYGVVDPDADEKALRRSLDQGFRGIKIKGGDGDAANDERMVKGVRALLGPDIALMIDFNQSLDPAEATRRIARLAPYDLHWIEEPVPQENLSGPRRGARDLADADPGRRELVVSARLCRSDRGRRQRLHHARPDEGAAASPAGCSVAAQAEAAIDPDVEPSVRRGQRARAGGDADRALARIARFRRRHPRRSRRDRRRHGDRAGAGSRASNGTRRRSRNICVT